MEFNSAPSEIMLMDINSCFATIEQQANPLIRGKPVAVAAFVSPGGCILAASVEAKKLGIKTGMRVKDGKNLYRDLIVLPPDPSKYRNVHLKLKNLISKYSDDFSPKSIDEFILNLKGYPCILDRSILDVAREIKQKIRVEVGEWITVSIGIAPNRYLAKIAGLHKPDGLDEINKENYLDIFSGLKLTDLTGIKTANATRLNSVGIKNVLDFYEAPIWKLKAAFHSITGLYWHTRLHGYEIDNIDFARRSYGNSVALGKNLSSIRELSPILARLTEKMSARLRRAGYKARGVHLSLLNKNGSFWHKGRLTDRELFDSRDFFKEAFTLLTEANPVSPVRNIAVSAYALTPNLTSQMELFVDVVKNESLANAMDAINERWGDFTLGMGVARRGENVVLDRIAFGGIKETEELRNPQL